MSQPDPYAPPRAPQIAPAPDVPYTVDVALLRRSLFVLLATTVLAWASWIVARILVNPRAGESMEAAVARAHRVDMVTMALDLMLMGVTIVALYWMSRLGTLGGPARAAIVAEVAGFALSFALGNFGLELRRIVAVGPPVGSVVVSAVAAASSLFTLVILKRAAPLLRTKLPMVLLLLAGSVVVLRVVLRTSAAALDFLVLTDFSNYEWGLGVLQLLRAISGLAIDARTFLFVACIVFLLKRRSIPTPQSGVAAQSMFVAWGETWNSKS
jgi:hypothetical protein